MADLRGACSAGVRIAVSAHDFHVFGQLLTQYEASLPEELRHGDFEAELSDLADCYRLPNAAYVAAVGDAPAGCVAMIARDAATAAVRHLYVAPAFRNFGVGRALMEALLTMAKRNAFSRVVLDTHKERLNAAYRLYRSLGFAECEPSWTVDYACATFMQLELR